MEMNDRIKSRPRSKASNDVTTWRSAESDTRTISLVVHLASATTLLPVPENDDVV
jgi:hypothetical protein